VTTPVEPPPPDYRVPPQAYRPEYLRPAVPPGGYPPPPPFPVSPNGYKLADFGDRLLAYLIDSLLVGFASGIILGPLVFFGVLTVSRNTGTDQDPLGLRTNPGQLPSANVLLLFLGLLAVNVLVTLIIWYLYEVEFMHRSGQTIGKRALKIKVIPVDPSLGLTRGMAFKRYLVQFVLAGVVPLLTYLDGFWQLWDQPYRQCLHDKYARTLVIKLNG